MALNDDMTVVETQTDYEIQVWAPHWTDGDVNIDVCDLESDEIHELYVDREQWNALKSIVEKHLDEIDEKS